MLSLIRDSLKEMTVIVSDTDQDKSPVDRLLAVMNDETLSASELMKRLGLSHCQTFRKNYLNPAMERNLIEPTVPDKPNSKNQKYRKIK